MLEPKDMRKVRIFVLARDEERVIRELGSLDVLHLRSSVEESGGELEPERLDQELEKCRDLLDRLEDLFDELGLEAPEEPPAGPLPTLQTADEITSSVEEITGEKREQLASVREGIRESEALVEELEPYSDMRASLGPLQDSEMLSVKAAKGDGVDLVELRAELPPGSLVVTLDSEGQGKPGTVLVISTRRRRFAVETALEETGLEEVELPTWGERSPADVYEDASDSLRKLRRKKDTLVSDLRSVGEQNVEALRRAWSGVRQQRAFCRARQKFGTTWATVVITGWVPAERAEELHQSLREATDGRCVVETSEPSEEEIEGNLVPTRVEHGVFFAPFARLVRGYGVPSYSEIEPTVMFAATFLLIFGLIFGDLGHGLVLMGAGWLMARFAGRDAVRDIGKVMAFCGVSSALWGTFFQGSFFGQSLRALGFPLTLGFEPMRFEGAGAGAGEHVMRYLLLAALLGVVLISLGAIMNVVNRLRRRDIEGALMGRFGVVGLVLYWGGLAWVIKLVVAGGGPTDLWLAGGLIGVPLLLLVVHRPLLSLLGAEGSDAEEGPVAGLFRGLIEAGETVMVYLANTFSFLRVAAFALSHAALCFTIFVLERLVQGLPGGPVWAALVFVLGTGLIIALEGLIVAIQILRLEYYEFFTKFFRGEGVQYEPFGLRTQGGAEDR